MGVLKTAIAAMTIHREFEYDWLLMSGVCAGHPDKTSQGDVVVSSQCWRYGPGKRNVHRNEGQFHESRKENVESLLVRPSRWTAEAYDFDSEFTEEYSTFLKGSWPVTSNFEYCFKTHIAAFQTVPDVTIDVDAFIATEAVQRDTLGIDMESYAIAAVAEALCMKGWMVAKGVQDHARPALGETDKNDKYRQFAARASALYILRFIEREFSQEPHRESTGKKSVSKRITYSSPASLKALPKQGWVKTRTGDIVHDSDERLRITISATSGVVDQAWLRKATGKTGVNAIAVLTNGEHIETYPFVRIKELDLYLPVPAKTDGKLWISDRLLDVASIVNLDRDRVVSYLGGVGISVFR